MQQSREAVLAKETCAQTLLTRGQASQALGFYKVLQNNGNLEDIATNDTCAGVLGGRSPSPVLYVLVDGGAGSRTIRALGRTKQFSATCFTLPFRVQCPQN